ncbi:hypothetical protein [Bradyrhizobium liaoningense]|uniref:hypothetical protein n=1 Tax=Bradyrhizobium liaoningense TaxID=43992 RepID=UPI001BAA665C|nr:hypothetical protein [Bradyrhizobium liaoningense]MBR0907021.1 hypothetical protein [Bradyrhizobium liaoningense]
MTAADILAAIERADRERDALMAQLRAMVGESSALQPSSATAPAPPKLVARARPEWMLAARAFARYPFNPWQVRRICANHDWALKLAGTWHVDLARFNEFADAVDRGEASFDSSEKFTSSLVNGLQLDEIAHASNSAGDERDASDQDRETVGAGTHRP